MTQYARADRPDLEGTKKEPHAHAFLTWTRMPGRARTVCNRSLDNPEVRDFLPATWRLCGSCERIQRARPVGLDTENDAAPI